MKDSPPKFEDLPEMCTVEETAAFLRIGKTTAYGLVASQLHAIKLGRLLRVPKREIERLVNGGSK